MGMPFKLVVDQPTFGDDPFDWTPSFFTGYALHLTENSETYIDFQGPPDARLYMEGLEQYCPHLGQFDTHGWYVTPRDEPYELYEATSNRPYPLIPGEYVCTVRIGSEQWEAPFTVRAKRVTAFQRETMIEEIEAVERGLATEWKEEQALRHVPSSRLVWSDALQRRLIDESGAIIASLVALRNHPVSDIVKRYEPTSHPTSRRTDAALLRRHVSRPLDGKTWDRRLVRQTDVIENRWMKRRLLELQSLLQKNGSCHASLRAIQEAITSLLQSDHWRSVDARTRIVRIPQRLLGGGPYGVLYRLLTHRPEQALTIVEMKKQSKRSDVLYELWGWIRLIGMLKEIGPFDMERLSDEVVRLTNGPRTLVVSHDVLIPRHPDASTPLVPLYTLMNNRPDCRIDFWENGTYYGSHMIDFKYRNGAYLWEEAVYDTTEAIPSVMRQLEAYRRNMRTHAEWNGRAVPLLTRSEPVFEVWAMYPLKYDTSEANDALNPYGIRLINFSPGLANEHVRTHLQRMIDQAYGRIGGNDE